MSSMNPARNSNSQSLLISKDADTDAADRRPDLFEHAPTAYLVVSECGILLEANCQAGILLRAGRSSILRQPVAQLIRPEDHSAFQNYCSRLTSSSHSSQPLSCELRMIRADGSWFRATLSSTKYHSENECLILISLRDAGNRSEAEAALEESQTRTRLLMHAANLALWDWNLLTDEVYFSPEWKHQLGYTDDEFPNNFNDMEEQTSPCRSGTNTAGHRRLPRRTAISIRRRISHAA